MNNGKLEAIYAWEAGSRSWRRYLPGVNIPGLNTLTRLPGGQTVWILAGEDFSLILPV
jgi:hypothetical protein